MDSRRQQVLSCDRVERGSRGHMPDRGSTQKPDKAKLLFIRRLRQRLWCECRADHQLPPPPDPPCLVSEETTFLARLGRETYISSLPHIERQVFISPKSKTIQAKLKRQKKENNIQPLHFHPAQNHGADAARQLFCEFLHPPVGTFAQKAKTSQSGI